MKCRNMTGTSFHNIWRGIKSRCMRPSCEEYKYYGGRGIKLSAEWQDFNNFYDDMYTSYLEHIEEFGKWDTTIERKDVNGDYCKENCVWATREEQGGNKRNTIRVYDENLNREISLMRYCNLYGLNYGTVYDRIRRGWSIDKAIKQPLAYDFHGSQHTKVGVI